VELARNLAAEGTFARGGRPEVMRTPGYPLFLVPGVLAGRVEVVAIALQVALSAATAAATYLLARALFGERRGALAGAAFFALEPVAVAHSVLLLSETLYAALAAWGVLLLARHLERGRARELVVGMALLCAAVYVRPAGYFLPFLLAGFLALRAARRRDLRLAARAALALGVAAALVLPWQGRNRARTGYGGFSAVSEMSLYFYNAGQVLAARDGVPFTEQRRRMGWPVGEPYLRAHPEQRGWTDARRYGYMGREGKRIIREHPWLYARIHAAGMARAALGSGGGEVRRLLDQPVPELPFARRFAAGRSDALDLLHLAMGLFIAGMWALAAYGVPGKRAGPRAPLLLAACVVAYSIAVAGGVGEPRFRIAALPFVCAAAGAGAVRARARLLARRDPASHDGGSRAPPPLSRGS
jgi:4-amino-4-deoxy-L-arabinose transferase-like glycosyltransferase